MYCHQCGTNNPDEARFCAGCGADLAPAGAQIPSAGGAPLQAGFNAGAVETRYGGFWRRAVALLIDAFIVSILQVAVFTALGIPIVPDPETFGQGVSGEVSGTEGIAQLLGAAVGWLYFAGLESSAWQATLGKKALGMYVTDLGGARIGFLRATGRYFAKILSALILLIGYFMAAFTVRKQALHDKMAGTLVRLT